MKPFSFTMAIMALALLSFQAYKTGYTEASYELFGIAIGMILALGWALDNSDDLRSTFLKKKVIR